MVLVGEKHNHVWVWRGLLAAASRFPVGVHAGSERTSQGLSQWNKSGKMADGTEVEILEGFGKLLRGENQQDLVIS